MTTIAQLVHGRFFGRCCRALSGIASGVVVAAFVSVGTMTVPGGAVMAQDPLDIEVLYLTRQQEVPLPLSLAEQRVEDNGRPGAALGLQDNNTTGSFLKHTYTVEELIVEEEGDIVAEFEKAGRYLVVADLEYEDLLAVADSETGKKSLIFNIRAKDNALRNEQCRRQVLHIAPSRSILTDGLAQYLVWKRWSKIAMIQGPHPEDRAYAQALEKSFKKFGLKVVEKKDWTFDAGGRRTDSGHHTAQQEIPAFTQFKTHDVVAVADERDEFGEYLVYRTYEPRPLVGTQGLMPTAWHRVHEQWGATQIQRRFEKIADRIMTPRDYGAWAAMRTIGEAVTRTSDTDPEVLRTHILGPEFRLAAFKGSPLTYRDWNGQLRQPVLLVAPRMLVTVSPQKEFLHEVSPLDTLGHDRPESSCEVFQQ